MTVTILFNGCYTKTVYVKPSCPKIEPLPIVPDINVSVHDGCICGSDTVQLFNGVGMLRQTEMYYLQSIEEYNKDFTK